MAASGRSPLTRGLLAEFEPRRYTRPERFVAVRTLPGGPAPGPLGASLALPACSSRAPRATSCRAPPRSPSLRREGELAFYGDIDFIPTEEYSAAGALTTRRRGWWSSPRTSSGASRCPRPTAPRPESPRRRAPPAALLQRHWREGNMSRSSMPSSTDTRGSGAPSANTPRPRRRWGPQGPEPILTSREVEIVPLAGRLLGPADRLSPDPARPSG